MSTQRSTQFDYLVVHISLGSFVLLILYGVLWVKRKQNNITQKLLLKSTMFFVLWIVSSLSRQNIILDHEIIDFSSYVVFSGLLFLIETLGFVLLILLHTHIVNDLLPVEMKTDVAHILWSIVSALFVCILINICLRSMPNAIGNGCVIVEQGTLKTHIE